MRACVSVCESDRKSNSEDKCEKARASLSKKAGTWEHVGEEDVA